jgi:hypothetical protein
MVSKVPSSRPLEALTRTASGSSQAAARPKTSRMACEGVTPTTMALPRTARSRSEVTAIDGGRVKPGR